MKYLLYLGLCIGAGLILGSSFIYIEYAGYNEALNFGSLSSSINRANEAKMNDALMGIIIGVVLLGSCVFGLSKVEK